jgi:WD40 repeat protein
MNIMMFQELSEVQVSNDIRFVWLLLSSNHSAKLNGKWIVSVSGANNGKILLLEVATRSKSAPVSFKGHNDVVGSIVFALDSETFASASIDKTVRVWWRKTGETVLGAVKADVWDSDIEIPVSASVS